MRIWLTLILILFWFGAKAPNMNIELEESLKKKSIEFYKQMKLQRFLKDMRLKESGNNWKIINSIGAMGCYQIMPNTLKSLGCELTPEIFELIPWIFPEKMQDQFMIELLNRNTNTLKYYINKYDNKRFRGVLITKSGILAAAHLAGAGNVIKWFKYGRNPEDINGTSLAYYMELFGGYGI